jgi:lipopolysaccharide transport system permease protein
VTVDESVSVLEAGRSERHYWRDLWSYRELFAILAWRDVAVRYKQTAIGVAWALLRPLLTMVALTLVFGRIAKLPSDGGAPYALMVFAGMLPWFLMTTIFGEAANSLVANANLIEKVYFPRMVIPFSSAAAALVDFSVNLIVFLVVAVWWGSAPTWRLALLPAFLAIAIVASLGPALLVAALNVQYRDFRYIIPFVLQFGLYVSPVGFSSNVVPEPWRLIYSLNPAVGVIDGFRWSLLSGETPLYWPGLCVSLVVAALSLWAGVGYFRGNERTMADVI